MKIVNRLKNFDLKKWSKNLFRKSKDPTRPKTLNAIIFVIFLIYAFTLIYPLVWAFLASLKPNMEYMMQNRNGWPFDPSFNNYKTAWKNMGVVGISMIEMIWNSLWYSAIGAGLNVFVCATTAYVLSRYNFPGRNLLYGVALLVMVLPIIGALPSQYRMYTKLGLKDSPFLLVTTAGGFGFNFIVLYAMFKGIARDYMESAFLDGAGHYKVYFEIMLPQAVSGMTALFIVMFIGRWNDYTTPLLFLKEYPTLSTGLYVYKVIMDRRLELPVYFAGIFICAIPTILLYVFFQNSIMDMSFGGGIKG